MSKSPRWNEKACPQCRMPIAVDALRCPHCTTTFDPQSVAQGVREHRRFMAGGCLGMLLLVGGLSWWMMPKAAREGEKPRSSLVAASLPQRPKTLADAVDGMKRCDAAMGSFAAAVEARSWPPADDAARRIAAACHDVSANYYSAAPTAETAEQEQRQDKCGDAYFRPEEIASGWLKPRHGAPGEFISAIAENRRARAACVRWISAK